MRIEENKVYMFTFETGEMGNLAIPIRGDSREDAANRLQNMFSRMQVELATDFPKVATTPATTAINSSTAPGADLAMPSTEGLQEILDERIHSLLDKLGGGALQGQAVADTIKNWTELEYVPGNYAQIVNALELIASGQKEVAPKPKKK